MKLVFDANVWIEHLRHDALTPMIPLLSRGFQLWMDAFVAAELFAGCRGRADRRLVELLVERFDELGRVSTPHPRMLADAGRALSRLREKGVALKKPAGAVIDAAIAMGCARSGSLLVTNNVSDFTKLATVMPVRFRSLAEFREGLGA